MIKEIVGGAHNVGHFSVRKTMELVERDYYIPGLQQKLENYMRNCIPCITKFVWLFVTKTQDTARC